MLTMLQCLARGKQKFKGIFCPLPLRTEIKLMSSTYINVNVYHMTIYLNYKFSLICSIRTCLGMGNTTYLYKITYSLPFPHLAPPKPSFSKSLSKLMALVHAYLYLARN